MRFKSSIVVAALALGWASAAPANVICTGCEYGSAAGSFLGAFDALRNDVATFQHSNPNGRFTDFWVFDVSPSALGSMSADFTLLTAIAAFGADLFRDNGSVCTGFDCSSIRLGALLGSADATNSRWEIVDFFSPGRYVLRIGGIDNTLGTGAYTGQMAFLAFQIRESGSLVLIGLGLFGLAWLFRKGNSHVG